MSNAGKDNWMGKDTKLLLNLSLTYRWGQAWWAGLVGRPAILASQETEADCLSYKMS